MTKVVAKNHNTHFVFSDFFLLFENRAVHKIQWKNTVEQGRLQMTTWHMRIACCIPKARDAHSEYVIVTAFPLQQSLHESAPMVLYTYIACLVIVISLFILL